MSEDGTMTGANELGDVDWNSEIIPDPLIPTGVYHGSIRKAEVKENKRIQITVQLEGNEDMVMNDQQSPVDGRKVMYFIHLPTDADRGELTPSGADKFKWKENNLKKELKVLNLAPTSKEEFLNIFEETQLHDVVVKAAIVVKNHYQTGVPQNEVKSITPA